MSTIAAVPLLPHGVTTAAERGPTPATTLPPAASPVAPRPAFVISISSLAASTALVALRSGDGQAGRAQTRIAASRPAGLQQAAGVAPTVSTDAVERAGAADALPLSAANAVKQGSVTAGTPDAGGPATGRIDLSA